MPPLEPPGSTSAPPSAGRPSASGYAFGPFLLDTRTPRLFRDNEPVAMPPRHLAVLQALVVAAGKVVSKDHLIEVGWGRAVSDSSLAKVVAAIRERLDLVGGCIATASGEGYQFVASVTLIAPAKIDVDVYALLAPDRIWGKGLAAIESLTIAELRVARRGLEVLVASHPHEARYRIGLALIGALLYDSTRADPWPDTATLHRAVVEAHEAVRLAPDLVEALATLAFVLERSGDHEHAVIAARRAVRLEPDNWLHHVRLAWLCWGPERQNAVRAALRLNSGLAIAWFLGATVPVATGSLDDAVKMVESGIKALEAEVRTSARFRGLALYYLAGLLGVAQGRVSSALEVLGRETTLESRGHVYSRECCANAYYAIGACYLILDNLTAAHAAFLEAVRRIPHHPQAWAGLAIVERRRGGTATRLHGGTAARLHGGTAARLHGGQTAPADEAALVCVLDWVPGIDGPGPASLIFEHEMARAALLVEAGNVPAAVQFVLDALQAAPPGNTGWLIPLDPLLRVSEHRELWEPVLELLRARAR